MTTPDYYSIPIQACGNLVSIEAMDVIDGLEWNFNLGCIFKYLVRHGRKQGEPALKDMKKARDCLNREIRRLESLEVLTHDAQ